MSVSVPATLKPVVPYVKRAGSIVPYHIAFDFTLPSSLIYHFKSYLVANAVRTFLSAEELELDDVTPDAKIVAYFCRLYAIDYAMRLNSAETKADVQSVVKQLLTLQEKLKPSLGSENTSREAGLRICEGFALSAFTKVDDEDRAGNATKFSIQFRSTFRRTNSVNFVFL